MMSAPSVKPTFCKMENVSVRMVSTFKIKRLSVLNALKNVKLARVLSFAIRVWIKMPSLHFAIAKSVIYY
jgi:hypothetical protein